MTRALLAPLEILYAAALRAKNRRYEAIEPRRLRWPVVSIGNLSVGGTGKTPFVIHLAQLLTCRGWSVDVLSRGYGRVGAGIERVEPAGDAKRFGDEPLLIAQTTGVPVYVGNSRYEAGLLAEQNLSRPAEGIHLLDDGFQHRQLARTADIILFRGSDLTDRLLPAGRLREPLEALQRADVVVLRTEEAEIAPRLQPYLRPDAYIWRVSRMLSIPGKENRVLAFCGLAHPVEFLKTLRSKGLEIGEQKIFRDHHPYSQRDIDELCRLAARSRCQAFVTTAKDAVKLDEGARSRLARIAPLRIAALSLKIEEEASAIDQLMALLQLRQNLDRSKG